MDLLVLAQLVTGIATLVVATVLIWQMIIQKKALDIAHNDADANMSLQAMESRSEQIRWFAENSTPELLQKLKKGYEYLNDKEKEIASSHHQNISQVLATEWRLGRLGKNPEYLRYTMGHHMKMNEYKGMRDIWKIISSSVKGTGLVEKQYIEVGDQVCEEISEKKLTGDKF